ncbi:DMT family transporter [Camelliibacillus cellulosilyticus]|uniref:DMT family transporter n=1 Tax=Camelliibacillus cellulosilyticus TaxID=2174486 RepID=A0ABV9GK48_9BACL
MKNKWMADIGLLFIAFIWGSTFVVVQDAVEKIPPLAFNGYRFFIGALVLIIVFVVMPKKENTNFNLGLILNGVFLGLLLFIGYSTQTIALLYTTSSKAAFITGLSVVLVPLLTWLILKQKPKKSALIGVMIATIGLYLLTALHSLSLNKGDGLALACAFAFGFHIIVTAKVTHKYSSVLLTIIQLTTVAVLSIISGIGLDGVKKTINLASILTHGDVIFACLFTALFATAAAFLMQTSLQRFTEPTHVGIIFIMEPVFAAITAAIFTNETMTGAAKLGALLILVGMLSAELPMKHKKEKHSQPIG